MNPPWKAALTEANLSIFSMNLQNHYAGKKILVTGHTGFKGSWMTQWLRLLGAQVYGYALNPPTDPALFDQLSLTDEITHKVADIRDQEAVKAYLEAVEPDIIFHMAAQPLVRDSYVKPLETVEVNTLGTAYLLDAVRQIGRSVSVVCITTDKCYSNQEWLFGYRENDTMGGYDVYSSSKGAAELLIDSWRNSFFNVANLSDHGIQVASVRAGNVIGGGDWAKDRIVPDCMRALSRQEAIEVRNPTATRPWQHVLEPVGGYLHLGAMMMDPERDPKERAKLCSGFNFGPLVTSNQPVRVLADKIVEVWGHGQWIDVSNPNDLHEASLLQLTIEKAFHVLGWFPRWDFDATVRYTTEWYREVLVNKVSPKEKMIEQIHAYEATGVPVPAT